MRDGRYFSDSRRFAEDCFSFCDEELWDLNEFSIRGALKFLDLISLFATKARVEVARQQ